MRDFTPQMDYLHGPPNRALQVAAAAMLLLLTAATAGADQSSTSALKSLSVEELMNIEVTWARWISRAA